MRKQTRDHALLHEFVDRSRDHLDTAGVHALEQEAFEAFYLTRSRWLIGALRSIVGPDAEDVAQDAFITLFQKWDVISRYDSPEAWLRRIAFRSAVRQRQRDATRPRNESLSALLEDSRDDAAPASTLIRDALKPLSATERESLVLRYFSDAPVQELAERFGCSEAAMRVRLHRACRKAREHLMGLCGTWVMDFAWTPDALTGLLESAGHHESVEPVLTEFDELGDIRTQLQIADGRFLLTNGPDEHLDHGTYTLTRDGLRLDSAGYRGGVTHRVDIEGDSLQLRQIENRNPDIHGATDDAFQLALLGSSTFTWHPLAS
jgi:RNA polymerase sigma-70 factor (ECF subfamily)